MEAQITSSRPIQTQCDTKPLPLQLVVLPRAWSISRFFRLKISCSDILSSQPACVVHENSCFDIPGTCPTILELDTVGHVTVAGGVKMVKSHECDSDLLLIHRIDLLWTSAYLLSHIPYLMIYICWNPHSLSFDWLPKWKLF